MWTRCFFNDRLRVKLSFYKELLLPYSIEDLAILEMPPGDADLPEEELKKKMRKQWYKLCLRYHPDKNPGYLAEFHAVTSVYNRLTKIDHVYQHEIHQFFAQEDIIIPDTAFDLIQQEGIKMAYEALLFKFSALKTDGEKRKFAQHYADFINLAESSEKHHEVFNSTRAESFYQQQQQQFASGFKREWRIVMLRLFADEFLDDFQYRHAIATGELWPILATIKLISPIKLLVALINSVILAIVYTTPYLFQRIIHNILSDFYQQYFSTEINVYNMALLVLKIIALVVVLALPNFLALSPENYLGCLYFACSLPLIMNCLEGLASPVNQCIRPLATHLHCSPVLISILSAMISIAATSWAVLHTALLMNAAVNILPYLILGLTIYNGYLIAKLIYRLYEVAPILAIFEMVLLAGSILIGLLAPNPVPVVEPTFSDMLGLFLMSFTSGFLLRSLNQKLENLSAAAADEMEILPFPTEPIAPALQQASLTGFKTASWSHRLFNTPIDADYIRPEERTVSQQWSCFFGGGAKPSKDALQFTEGRVFGNPL